MPPPHFFNPVIFGTELAFTILIIILSLIIYFRTKESYELTKYQGIGLFRKAFLFFGLSYLMRFFFMLSRALVNFHLFKDILAHSFTIFLGYLSTMAIFYLIFSLIWKKFNLKSLLIFGHLLAFLLTLILFVTRSYLLLIYIQSFFLIGAVLTVLISHKKKKPFIKTIYLMIFIFWLINLWAILPGRIILPEIKIILNLISIGLFLIIFYKVAKWIK